MIGKRTFLLETRHDFHIKCHHGAHREHRETEISLLPSVLSVLLPDISLFFQQEVHVKRLVSYFVSVAEAVILSMGFFQSFLFSIVFLSADYADDADFS